MQLQKENLGKVAITIEQGYWDINKDYDKLVVVEVKDKFATYVSRKPVPAGTVLTNREYWIPFSSLKESIIIAYNDFIDRYNKKLIDHENRIVELEGLKSLVEQAVFDINETNDKANTTLNQAILAVSNANKALHMATDLLELKGKPNGLATLDETGRVPSKQLPSYVDDVLEFASYYDFPEEGEKGKIYVDLHTNLTYRWSGSTYIKITIDEFILDLGEFESAAEVYRETTEQYVLNDSKHSIFCFRIIDDNGDFPDTPGVMIQSVSRSEGVIYQCFYDDKAWVQSRFIELNRIGNLSNISNWYYYNPLTFYYDNNNRTIYLRDEFRGLEATSVQLPLATGEIAGLSEYNFNKTEHDKLAKTSNDVENLKQLVTDIHTTVDVTASPSLVEKGANTSVTINSSAKFNNVNLTHTKTISVDGTQVSNPHTISNTTKFAVNVNINNEDPKVVKSVLKTITVNAVYPRYYGRIDKGTLTIDDVFNLSKQAISTSPNGTYEFTSNYSDYLWLCVPNNMRINKVSSSGFDVAMNEPITVMSPIKGAYKCYRSTLKINTVSLTITIQ